MATAENPLLLANSEYRHPETRERNIPKFSYPGGKGKLAKEISKLLPRTSDRFVEVFAGRANLFFRVAQQLDYSRFWLNDIATYPFLLSLCGYAASAALGHGTVPPRNGRTAHDLMKGHSLELVLQQRMRYNPIRKQVLNALWNLRPDLHEWARTTLAHPADVLEPYLVRDGNRYGKAGVRGEVGGGVSRATYQHYLKVASEIMMRVQPHITWMDYREVLQQCGSTDVVYLDPPYFRYARKTGAYTESLDHREMVNILLRAPFRWVLSEYEDAIYQPLTSSFGEPTRIVVPKTMNDSNHHGGTRPKAVECIWRNF